MADLNIGTLAGKLTLENQMSTVLAKVDSDLKGFETGLVKSGAGVSSFAGKFDILKGATTSLSSPLDAASAGLSTVAGGLGPAAVAAVATGTAFVGLGAAMFTMAGSAAAVGAAFGDMSDTTGLSVPALSQLSNASKVIGADLSSLTGVVFKLETKMEENSKSFQEGLGKMSLSTAELKAAGPDRYLQLVTAGLQGITDPSAKAAAGTAVLGKGYRDVAAALNDLDAGMRLTADISPWTKEQADAAEAFEQKVASLGTHVADVSTSIGALFIPAAGLFIDGVSRMALAVKNVADLGGLVSGSWKGITLTLGEAALAEQTLANVTGTANRLFSEQGATAENVAGKLLAMGFGVITIATNTGLAVPLVQGMADASMSASAAAEKYSDMWTRVNTALAVGTPTLEGVSDATRGLVKDMSDAGVSLKDMALAADLSEGQVKLLLDTTKKLSEAVASAAAAEVKKFSAALAELGTIAVDSGHALDSVDGTVVAAVQHYLAAGVAQTTLATAYGLTAAQLRSIDSAMKAGQATAEARKKSDAEWAKTLTDVAFGAKTLQQRIDSIDGSVVVWTTDLLKSGVSAQDAAKFYGLTSLQVAAIQQRMAEGKKTATDWGASLKNAADSALASVKTLSGELITAAEAQKRLAAGGSANITRETFAASARGLGAEPGSVEILLKQGYSFEQALMYSKHPDWPPPEQPGPRMPGFQSGGPTTAGPAMLHSGEYVVPSKGALVVRDSPQVIASTTLSASSPAVTFAPGAVVVNMTFPIMRDRQAMDQIGEVISEAVTRRMMKQGGFR